MGLNGVDIASYQKDMRCDKVDADFIIVKATQGVSYTNPTFEKQMNDAMSAKKLVGLYHYSNGCGAVKEADYFLSKIGKFIHKAILCLDWEHNENGGANPVFGSANEVQYVLQFAERVYEKAHVWPFVYMSASVTRRKDWSIVAKNCPLWVAQYPNYDLTGYKSNPWKDNKGLGAWDKYWNGEKIRQYSSCGTIKGYEQTQPHKLDLDIAYMTADEWNKLAGAVAVNHSVAKKVTPQIVEEVLAGKYGIGASRVQNLAKEGYNVVDVQQKINELHNIAVKQVKPIKDKVGEYWPCLLDLL